MPVTVHFGGCLARRASRDAPTRGVRGLSPSAQQAMRDGRYFDRGLLPAPFLAIDLLWCQKPEWFAPSGVVTLFLVAFVQFRQLALLQNKHFTNARRARDNEAIQVLSREY